MGRSFFDYLSVMPGLVPGIHVFLLSSKFYSAKKTWMAGTSPAMTNWNK
jgi:hypothetical protein